MAQQTADFVRKVGDLEPPLEFWLKYDDGTPVDLTGVTVTVRCMTDAGAFAWTGTATVVTAAEGHCRYALAAGNTATAGMYQIEVKGVAGGRTLSAPQYGFMSFAVNDGAPAA